MLHNPTKFQEMWCVSFYEGFLTHAKTVKRWKPTSALALDLAKEKSGQRMTGSVWISWENNGSALWRLLRAAWSRWKRVFSSGQTLPEQIEKIIWLKVMFTCAKKVLEMAHRCLFCSVT